jgi:hypothetical protein
MWLELLIGTSFYLGFWLSSKTSFWTITLQLKFVIFACLSYNLYPLMSYCSSYLVRMHFLDYCPIVLFFKKNFVTQITVGETNRC